MSNNSNIQKELKELVSVSLDSLGITDRNPFIVETMDLDINMMMDNDTLLPVILLYLDYATQILFNEKYIEEQIIFKTHRSLFYVKWDMEKSVSENFYMQTHIKALLIHEFIKKFLSDNKKINLTMMVVEWREALEAKYEENQSINISEMKDNLLDKLFYNMIITAKD